MHNYNIRFIFVNINIKIKFGITLRRDEIMGTGLMVHFLKGGIYKNEPLTPSPRDHLLLYHCSFFLRMLRSSI